MVPLPVCTLSSLDPLLRPCPGPARPQPACVPWRVLHCARPPSIARQNLTAMLTGLAVNARPTPRVSPSSAQKSGYFPRPFALTLF